MEEDSPFCTPFNWGESLTGTENKHDYIITWNGRRFAICITLNWGESLTGTESLTGIAYGTENKHNYIRFQLYIPIGDILL